MRTNKLFFIAIVVLAAVFGAITFSARREHELPMPRIAEIATTAAQQIAVTPPPAPSHSSAPPSEVFSQPAAPAVANTRPLASIMLEGTSYPIPINAGENVFDLMNDLKSLGEITFTTREYVGMGEMILSINGKISNSDMTWIFYVNGQKSNKGVSSVVVSPGDVIEWKYEKVY